MKRRSIAVWYGTIKNGKGHLTTASTVLNQTQYSFNSRFAEGVGANPEELLAAAHAGCFTMKLSLDLSNAGYLPDVHETESVVTLLDGNITESALVLKAKVPGITEELLQQIAQEAEKTCPISQVLRCTITLAIHLV